MVKVKPRKAADGKKKDHGDSPSLTPDIGELFNIPIEPTVESLSAAMKGMVEAMKEMATSMQFQSKSFDDMLAETKKQPHLMEELKAEVNAYKIENSGLKTENENLKVKLNELEQYSKNYNLEFKGIPVTQGENVYNIVANICEKIGCEVNVEDLELCHRIKKGDKQKPNTVPTIIAKLYSRRCKDEVLFSKRKLDLFAKDIGYPSSESEGHWLSKLRVEDLY